MVEIFCNIPLNEVLSIKANDINNIVEDINTIFLLEPKFKDRFIYNGVEFGFIPKLDDMSFGEYIDLDTYLPDWQQMHKAINVLYRPIKYSKKEKYLVEEYESADKYDMKNVSLDIVFGSLVFFWNLKRELLNHILKYLANQEEVNLPHQKLDLMKNGLGISQYMDWHKVMSGGLMKSLI